tara:strand:- start:711 stop:1550 length:840 start_codon:yes stop_codon:yes gene_type:complete
VRNVAGIAPPGLGPTLLLGIMSLSTFMIAVLVADPSGIISLIGVLLACNCAFMAFFHRDPDRPIPRTNGLLVSPADGCVMFVVRERATGRRPTQDELQSNRIEVDPHMGDWFPEPCSQPLRYSTEQRWEKVSEGEESRLDSIRIAIYMSPLDVHVQRSPLAGSIVHMEHRTGKGRRRGPHLRASRKESEGNERIRTVVEHEAGRRVEITQISGAVARTIVPYTGPGESLRRGQRIGMIRFGSRVDIRFSADNYEVLVSKGSILLAGQDKIAQDMNLESE